MTPIEWWAALPLPVLRLGQKEPIWRQNIICGNHFFRPSFAVASLWQRSKLNMSGPHKIHTLPAPTRSHGNFASGAKLELDGDCLGA